MCISFVSFWSKSMTTFCKVCSSLPGSKSSEERIWLCQWLVSRAESHGSLLSAISSWSAGDGGPGSQELPGSLHVLAMARDRLHFLAFALEPKVQVWKAGLRPLVCWSQDTPSSARSEFEGGVPQHSRSGTCHQEGCQGCVPTAELGLPHILCLMHMLDFWATGQRHCADGIKMSLFAQL